MGRFVIATYRPLPGKEAELLQCVRDHMPILREQKLITDRPAYAMRARDGSIVEIFEWKSEAAVQEAHRNPAVLQLWERFGACSHCVPLATLEEPKELFPHFDPVELPDAASFASFNGSQHAWGAVD
jgi:quinol monooxygenase YgiN